MTAPKEAAAAPADPLAKLREPFPPHQISKLPKETRAQIDARKANANVGIKCTICGSWHHKDAVHLDYVGHAALTDRLLDTDPHWSWEPVAFRDGLPAFDHSGGLWIRLTVCGVTRLGYGHAASKPNMDPGAREKEVIGDALRNAAMRFGAALDLWHKGDLHGENEPDETDEPPPLRKDYGPSPEGKDWWGCDGSGMTAYAAKREGLGERHEAMREEIGSLTTAEDWRKWCSDNTEEIAKMPKAWRILLRQDAEAIAVELGVDLNQRRAA